MESRHYRAGVNPDFVRLPQCLNIVWGRYYFDTFRKKAKEGENFKGNKNLNGNLGKSGFDTFRCKVGRN